jgi:hypothetical protein
MKSMILFAAILVLVGCVGTPVKDTDGTFVRQICIEGHIYYTTEGLYQGGIAPKLDDDGKPCDCQPKGN